MRIRSRQLVYYERDYLASVAVDQGDGRVTNASQVAVGCWIESLRSWIPIRRQESGSTFDADMSRDGRDSDTRWVVRAACMDQPASCVRL